MLVPVLSPSGAGCRSTVAGLLSATFATVAKTVLLDASTPALSPWPSWVTQPTAKVATWRHDFDSPPAGLLACAAVQHLGAHSWHVLSPRALSPETSPLAPQQWVRLARAGGWSVAVIDTGHSALVELDDGPDPVWSATAAWIADLPTSPVLALANTVAGLDHAHRFVTACGRLGLSCSRLTVALVDICAGRQPRQALRAGTVLAGRVGVVVRLPFDPQIAALGLSAPDRVRPASQRSARVLAAALVDVGSRQGPPRGRTTATARGMAMGMGMGMGARP